MNIRVRINQFKLTAIRFLYSSKGGVLFGRVTGEGTGEEIEIGDGLEFDGNTLKATASSSSVSDDAYDATAWNGVTDTAPSKNAVRDKLVAIDAAVAGIKPPDAVEFVGNDPNANYLATAFAGGNNDVVLNGTFTQVVIIATPSINPTSDVFSYGSGIVTVSVGSPGGNVAGTMTANELIAGMSVIPQFSDQLAPIAVLASGNLGTGNVVPGNYNATLAPVADYVGQWCLARNAFWQSDGIAWRPRYTWVNDGTGNQQITFSQDLASYFILGVNSDSAVTTEPFLP